MPYFYLSRITEKCLECWVEKSDQCIFRITELGMEMASGNLPDMGMMKVSDWLVAIADNLSQSLPFYTGQAHEHLCKVIDALQSMAMGERGFVLEMLDRSGKSEMQCCGDENGTGGADGGGSGGGGGADAGRDGYGDGYGDGDGISGHGGHGACIFQPGHNDGVADIGVRLGDMEFRKVVVLSGAGLSVSAGIPDFRSPSIGLYERLRHLKLPRPEAVFDITYFRENPVPFYRVSKEIWPREGSFTPTLAHHAIRLFHENQCLLRNYTQNIDGLERLAGVPEDKLIECHGTFSAASCIDCKSS